MPLHRAETKLELLLPAVDVSNRVLYRSTQKLFHDLCADSAGRAERELRRAVGADLLILDDFAFRKLDQREAELLYVLAEERLGKASTVAHIQPSSR
jgi:DNA replication protein DnaC